MTYTHLSVYEFWEKTHVSYDVAGERVRKWSPIYLVWDTEITDDEEGWFALVRYDWVPGYRSKRLCCSCSEGFGRTESECRHERAVVGYLNPAPERVRGLGGERRFDAAVFTE